MKKLLIFLFGIVTIGLVNFSSATLTCVSTTYGQFVSNFNSSYSITSYSDGNFYTTVNGTTKQMFANGNMTKAYGSMFWWDENGKLYFYNSPSRSGNPKVGYLCNDVFTGEFVGNYSNLYTFQLGVCLSRSVLSYDTLTSEYYRDFFSTITDNDYFVYCDGNTSQDNYVGSYFFSNASQGKTLSFLLDGNSSDLFTGDVLGSTNQTFDSVTTSLLHNSPATNSGGGSGTGDCDYSDYILISDVTKNYCTNLYSDLIPEEDITSGYCETEFGLIDPENCPSSGGTGDIQWSSVYINDRQVQGASEIYLYLPDFLSWDYTYLNSGSTMQVVVENEGDTEYIQNILDIQSYHPDKDQFAQSFAGFLTLLMPYIIITLFIVFVWRLIRRIFK